MSSENSVLKKSLHSSLSAVLSLCAVMICSLKKPLVVLQNMADERGENTAQERCDLSYNLHAYSLSTTGILQQL